MDKETKRNKIRSVLKTFNREFAEYYLDDEIPDWRELEPEWQSITRLSPGDPERWRWGTTPKDVTESFDEWRDRTGRSTLDLPDTQEVQGESQEKLPEKIDLSSKEVQTRIQDEIKQYLEEINDSVDLYPEPEPMEPSGQAFQETRKFSTSEKQISLKKYPHLERLVKSVIVDHIRQGRGRQPYMPHEVEQFLSGVKDYYKESKQLTTEGTFDVNLVSPIGFHGTVRFIKEFLKSQGIVAQTGFSQQLRQVLRYVSGTFETGSVPGWRGGKNPIVTSTLQEIPLLEELPNGLFILKLLRSKEDKQSPFFPHSFSSTIVDASDLKQVYEEYIENPEAQQFKSLPEQMRGIEDTRVPSPDEGVVRSMLDIRQPGIIGVNKNVKDIVDYIRNQAHPIRKTRIEFRKPSSVAEGRYTPGPDPEEEEEEILEVPDIPPIPRKKPKPSGKPSATSPLAQKLRQRAAARLEVENEKARQRLGIQSDDTTKPKTVPAENPDPKGIIKGPGLWFYLKKLEHLWGAGSVTEKGEPLASLEDQMTKLTG